MVSKVHIFQMSACCSRINKIKTTAAFWSGHIFLGFIFIFDGHDQPGLEHRWCGRGGGMISVWDRWSIIASVHKKKTKKLKRLPLAGHDSTDARQPCSGRGTLLSVWPGMTDFISSIEDFFFFLTVISMFEYTCIYNLDWWMVYANMNWLTSITNTRYDFIMFFVFFNLNLYMHSKWLSG